MTYSTVSPTDFLLAQIAAEERLAHDCQDVWSTIAPHYKPVDGAAHHRDDWMKREAFSLNINPWFVLKQCEAKRQLVQLYLHYVEVAGDHAGLQAMAGALGETLQILAQPYADHPAFPDEWRQDEPPTGQHGPTADYGEG